MFRILLVEDEKIIRERLRKTIDWWAMECEIVGEAGNVNQALALTNRLLPHVAIVDMHLAGENGLAYMEKTQKRHPDLKFIVLSGYGEFEYAQSAMQYGAMEYLLKPLQKDRMELALQKVLKKIRQEEHVAAQLCDARTQLHMADLEKQLLSYLETGQGDVRRATALLRKGAYAVAIFTVEAQQTTVGFPETAAVLLAPFETVILNGIYSTWVVLVQVTADALEIQLQLHKVQKVLSDSLQKTVYAGIAVEGTDHDRLYETYAEAKYRLRENQVFQRTEYTKPSGMSAEQPFPEKQLQQCLMHRDRQTALALMEALFQKISNLKDLERLNTHLQSLFYRMFPQYADEIEIKNFEHLSDCRNEWQRLLELCMQEAEEAPTPSEQKNRHFVQRAVELITERYMDSHLSLADIAAAAYVSPAYLSSTFKKERGESVSAYLTSVRMQHAAAQLLLGDKTVVQVAEACGYNDVYYFSKCFKTRYGSSPSEYVLSHHGKDREKTE